MSQEQAPFIYKTYTYGSEMFYIRKYMYKHRCGRWMSTTGMYSWLKKLLVGRRMFKGLVLVHQEYLLGHYLVELLFLPFKLQVSQRRK